MLYSKVLTCQWDTESRSRSWSISICQSRNRSHKLVYYAFAFTHEPSFASLPTQNNLRAWKKFEKRHETTNILRFKYVMRHCASSACFPAMDAVLSIALHNLTFSWSTLLAIRIVLWLVSVFLAWFLLWICISGNIFKSSSESILSQYFGFWAFHYNLYHNLSMHYLLLTILWVPFLIIENILKAEIECCTLWINLRFYSTSW